MHKNVNNVKQGQLNLFQQVVVYNQTYKIVMQLEWIKILVNYNVGIVKQAMKLIIKHGKVVKESVVILTVLIVQMIRKYVKIVSVDMD